MLEVHVNHIAVFMLMLVMMTAAGAAFPMLVMMCMPVTLHIQLILQACGKIAEALSVQLIDHFLNFFLIK
jgi:hypothetical protein